MSYDKVTALIIWAAILLAGALGFFVGFVAGAKG